MQQQLIYWLIFSYILYQWGFSSWVYHVLLPVTRLHKNYIFYFEVIVYAMIFPCTTTGYIDIVLVVQVGGRSSGRGGWTTGLQLQGNILSWGYRKVADLYVEFGPLEIQYAIP